MIEKVALVAIGGGIGAVMRFLGAAWFGRLVGAGFLGTMFVNVLGSFLMGLFAVMIMERMPGNWGRLGPFMITGILGGFTTFSAFSLDALYLLERGKIAVAMAYVGGSVLLSIAALFAGLVIARTWL